MKLLSLRQVLNLVPVSRATLARWEAAGLFPKRHHRGNGTWKKAFWYEDDVLHWIEAQRAQEAHASS